MSAAPFDAPPPEIVALIRSAREAHPDWIQAEGNPGAAVTLEVLPRYGGWIWRAMTWNDSRKWAAMAVAAEAWRDHCSPERVAADLRAQLAAEDQAVHARLRATSHDVRSALPAGWVDSTSHAELVRRRSS